MSWEVISRSGHRQRHRHIEETKRMSDEDQTEPTRICIKGVTSNERDDGAEGEEKEEVGGEGEGKGKGK